VLRKSLKLSRRGEALKSNLLACQGSLDTTSTALTVLTCASSSWQATLSRDSSAANGRPSASHTARQSLYRRCSTAVMPTMLPSASAEYWKRVSTQPRVFLTGSGCCLAASSRAASHLLNMYATSSISRISRSTVGSSAFRLTPLRPAAPPVFCSTCLGEGED